MTITAPTNSLLKKLRCRIDRLDRELLRTLASRMRVSEEIGRSRRESGVTALQINRWRQLAASRTAQGEKMKLPAKFVSKLFQLIHNESLRRQNRIIGRSSG